MSPAFWLLLGMLICSDIQARPQLLGFNAEYLAEVFGQDEGFPENSCSGISLADDGSLWMGTFRGLYRFNGREFKPFSPEAMPGLASKGIVNMFKDRKGRIWISTMEGLVMNEGSRWTRWREAEGFEDPDDYVRTYSDGPDGGLYLTLFSGRALKLEGNKFVSLPTPPGSGGSWGAVDADGYFYTVRSGIARVLMNGAWIPVAGHESVERRVVGTGQSRDGSVWIFRRDELLRVKARRIVETISLSADVSYFWQLFEDSRGNIWLPGINSGVYRVNRSGHVKHLTRVDGLPYDGATRAVHEDREGGIWVGSGVGGVVRFRHPRFRYVGEAAGLSDRVVQSVAVTGDGNVLLATYGTGLKIFDGRQVVSLPDHLDSVVGRTVRTLLCTRDGAVWIGTFGNGLLRMSGGTVQPVATNLFLDLESVSTLFEDSRGTVWIGGVDTVARYTSGSFHRVSVPKSRPSRVPTLFGELEDGRILAAKNNRLFTILNDSAEPAPFLELPEGVRVSSLQIDGKKQLWIGTTSSGLFVLKDKELRHLSKEEGLPADFVGSLILDRKGLLWFGAGRRAVQVDPDVLWKAAANPGKPEELLVFDKSDGLPGLDFSNGTQPAASMDSMGRLWFALIRGAAVVDPATILLRTTPPAVVMESMSFLPPGARSLANARIGSTNLGTVQLPAGSRWVRFDFSTTDLVAPQKQKFRVRLGDVTRGWQDTGKEAFVVFHELPPGHHLVEVEASGSDGVRSLVPTTIAFHIAPYYWQTNWFRTGCLLGLVTLIGGISRWTSSRKLRIDGERLARERQMAELQARLALVLQNTSDFVAFARNDGMLFFINEAGRKMIGLDADEPISSRKLSDFHPGWANEWISGTALPSALKEGTAAGESALLHKDGREIPVSLVLIVHRGADGALEFTSTVARDISKARQNARIQEALRNLSYSLTASILPTELGRIVARECRPIFSQDAFILDLVLEDRVTIQNLYSEDTSEGESQPKPYRSRNSLLAGTLNPVVLGQPLLINRRPNSDSDTDIDGSHSNPPSRRSLLKRLCASQMFVPIRWEKRVIGIISVQSYKSGRYSSEDLDLLQTFADQCGAAIIRMSIESSLRANQQRLQLAMESARLGSWEINLESRNLIASAQAEAIYGVSPGGLGSSPTSLFQLIPAGEDEDVRRQFDDALSLRRDSVEVVHRIVLPDKTERWLEIKGRVHHDPQSRESRLVGMTADVTVRMEAQKERERLEAQLRQSQKIEAIGTLSGGIAHDFNNILAAILGNVEILRDEIDPSNPTHESAIEILKATHRARDLVRRIVAFTLPEKNVRKVVRLEGVLQDAAKLLKATIPANISISVQVSPDAPAVEADGSQIHQVLLNLGTNSWHAMEGRSGRIDFRLTGCEVDPAMAQHFRDLAPGRYARIDVSDTGKGIDPANLGRIFDPFFTTKAPGEGSGLGLSVVHGIIRSHNGAIHVDSTLNAGTTFQIFLPAAGTIQPAAASDWQPGPARLPISGRIRRILLVDDEEALIFIARRLLTKAGYEITAFTRPAEALARFHAAPNSFDLLVTDLAMPEMSGIELTREIQRIRPSMPIVMMTGYLRPGDRDRAIELGIHDIFLKPDSVEELVPMIERCCQPVVPPGGP